MEYYYSPLQLISKKSEIINNYSSLEYKINIDHCMYTLFNLFRTISLILYKIVVFLVYSDTIRIDNRNIKPIRKTDYLFL